MYGFDLLRGLLAFSVMVYHLLSWSNTANLYNLGTFGVYGFFVLSGASMYVAYSDRMASISDLVPFLVQRLFRIAPLLIVVGLAWPLLIHTIDKGDMSWRGLVLDVRTVLTMTPLFGFANPGASSSVVGAWSLGVEFVFYAIFPVLLALYKSGWKVAIWVCVLFAVVQAAFLRMLFADGKSFAVAWDSYTQFGAFGFYFAAGMAIGKLVESGSEWWLTKSRLAVTSAFLVVAAFIAGSSGASAEITIRGGFGFFMMLCVCIMVYLSAYLPIGGKFVRIAEWLGLLSYPVYLIHPLVWPDALRWSGQLTGGSNVLVATLLTISLTVCLSVGSWKLIERPAMDFGKRCAKRFLMKS
ncbi:MULTISPECIES: acyltransferase family protein [Burkholderiales]|uniref:acyltransferase family protein n=1 Tax=Burkholderiales TaxID=80840 RepID=UPI00359FD5EF